MKRTELYSRHAARDIALRALTFLTSDEIVLSRFLAVTGWTPAAMASPGSESALLETALDYLMSEEDLLLTFTANADVDPVEVARAHCTLAGGGMDGPSTEG